MSTAKNTPQTRSQAKKLATRSTSSSHHSGSFVSKNFKLINILVSSTLLIVLIFGFTKYHQYVVKVPKLTLITDRLIYTLQLQTFSLLPYLASLLYVMLTRLVTNAGNPMSGNDHLVELKQRILTNTLEQLVYSFLNQIILVTFIPAEHLFVIPLLVLTFTLGRVLFMVGYLIHPEYRSLGFIMSFVPTSIALFMNLLFITGLNKYLSFSILASSTKKAEL